MRDITPTVIFIPPKPEAVRASKRQLRVAAYCRVSTDDEEQLTSYEAQKNYYTDKIMTNKEWTMAGIFADEGITGTSARKRPEFLRMIRQCKQGKIDIVLTKSISRFARNTVDCLNYVRALKELGIAVIFEKENMNTLEIDSEILITMLGAFAQSESESISANVRWGKRQAMKEGKAIINYKHLYGYRKGADGKPEILPEQAEIVRKIYDLFLSGTPIRGILEYLNANSIPNISGESQWAKNAVNSILTNEKYCGDVLLQKTYIDDCINKKVKKNTGQLPMYLVQNHHEGIISRETFDAAQAELSRRNAGRSPSKKNAPTGRSRYSSKYALSDRLYCGECGTRYQRCTWRNRDGSKRIVWRCVSRVDYGNKYCHDSPTLDEEPLHRAILAAINSAVKDKDNIVAELEALSGEEIARQLIESGSGTITPYGVVYDNGMKLEQAYDGQFFPCYYYEPRATMVTVTSKSEPEDTEHIAWLYLPPLAQEEIDRALQRAGIVDPADIRLRVEHSQLPNEVNLLLNMQHESLADLNALAQTAGTLSTDDIKKLGAVVTLAKPQDAEQVKNLAENLDLFDFAPDTHSPAEYGKYMIQQSGHFDYDANLDEFYDYEGYALQRMNNENGMFTDRGYIAYNEYWDIEEIMNGSQGNSMEMSGLV